jgi:hypothetical protein
MRAKARSQSVFTEAHGAWIAWAAGVGEGSQCVRAACVGRESRYVSGHPGMAEGTQCRNGDKENREVPILPSAVAEGLKAALCA